MKPLKIWNPEEAKVPEEPQHFLALRAQGHEIQIVAVDESGACRFGGALWTINTKTREVWQVSGVNAVLGFQLDAQGRIQFHG